MITKFEPNLPSRSSDHDILRVELGGISYLPSAASATGFRVENFIGAVVVGEAYVATFELPQPGSATPLEILVKVTAIDPAGVDFELLEQVPALTSAFTQAAAPIAAEAPRPIPLPPGVTPASQTISPFKTFLYAVVSTAAVVVLTYYAYQRLSTITIPDGMLVTNYLPMGVAEPVQLTKVCVKEGEAVVAGDVLFETDGGAAIASLKTAEMQLKTVRSERESILSQMEEEKQRIELFANVTHLRIGRQKASIHSFEAAAATAKRYVDSSKQLLNSKSVAAEEYARAKDANEIALSQLDEAEADLNLLRLNERAATEGRYFDGKDVQGHMGELTANLKVIETRISQAEQEVQNLQRRVSAISVRAPIAGKVYGVFHRAGELINPSMTVLSINTEDQFWVIGNLKPDEAYHVQPSGRVDVWVPGEHRHLTGHVESIGRHALAGGNEGSTTLEAAAATVPFKVVFDEMPRDLSPGIRVVVDIHLKPLGRLNYR